MNKSDLVREMSTAANISQADAGSALNALIGAISDALANGDRVSIPDFGSFEVRHRGARSGRNPQTGEAIEIKASKNAAFKAGKALKTKLNS
ncbi:MAG: HU family DNA-binding protein [Gammaproteobacteria bacterium]|nr:HU family DNA-binding protein [Gammaproteobacteria bacterium]